jgi:hypothetical protein
VAEATSLETGADQQKAALSGQDRLKDISSPFG